MSESDETNDVVTDFGAMLKSAKRETGADRIVAYRSEASGRLFCVRHGVGDTAPTRIPLASEDLPDGGICYDCSADVLA